MKLLLVCFASLFSLSCGQALCPSKVLCPGDFWQAADPDFIPQFEYDIGCMREHGYSSWFLLHTTSPGTIHFMMQAREDIDSTTSSSIDWAFFSYTDDCLQLTETEVKGCTQQQGGVYDLPRLNLTQPSSFAVLVKSENRVSIKVTSVDPSAHPTYNCEGSNRFHTQAEADQAYLSPTPAPTQAPTNAPTWPAHMFVPKLVRHDAWYDAYTNAPTPASVEYEVPTPTTVVYVPAKKGTTRFPYCLGFGGNCQPAYNHY